MGMEHCWNVTDKGTEVLREKPYTLKVVGE